MSSDQITGREMRGGHPYVFRLEDMADHLVLPFSILGWVGGFHVLLGVGAGHPPAGHQHNNVPYICDVGNGPQRVVHHGFLEGRWERLVSLEHHLMTQERVCHPQCSQGQSTHTVGAGGGALGLTANTVLADLHVPTQAWEQFP